MKKDKKDDLKNEMNDPEEKDLAEEKMEQMEKELEDILTGRKKKPLGVRILEFLIIYVVHLVLMYAVCLVTFGAFMGELELPSKFLVFAIAGGISLILTFLELLPMLTSNPHSILYLVLFGLVIAILCLMNEKIFHVFSFSCIWVFYIIIAELIYFLAARCIRKMSGGLYE